MQICRIEHKSTGEGPYNCSLYRPDEIASKNGLREQDLYNSYTCPSPMDPSEFGLRFALEPDDKWRYGFSDLDQMFAWFSPEWLKVLSSLDFHLVIYQMEYYKLTVRQSKSQVAFQPRHATRIGEMELL